MTRLTLFYLSDDYQPEGNEAGQPGQTDSGSGSLQHEEMTDAPDLSAGLSADLSADDEPAVEEETPRFAVEAEFYADSEMAPEEDSVSGDSTSLRERLIRPRSAEQADASHAAEEHRLKRELDAARLSARSRQIGLVVRIGLLAVLAILVGLLIWYLVSVFREPVEQEPDDARSAFRAALDTGDFSLANALWLEENGDPAFRRESENAARTAAEAVVSSYVNGSSTWIEARDGLDRLAAMAVYWSDEDRTALNMLQVRSVSELPGSELITDCHEQIRTIRDDRIALQAGDKLLDAGYTGNALDWYARITEDSLVRSGAADDIATAERQYRRQTLQLADELSLEGLDTAALAILDGALERLPDDRDLTSAYKRILGQAEPGSQSLEVTLTALAQAYIDAGRYQESIALIQSAETWLADRLADAEAAGDEAAVEFYGREIERSQEVAAEFTATIVNRLKGQAAEFASQQNYREARDKIETALTILPGDQALLDLWTEYDARTRLALTSWLDGEHAWTILSGAASLTDLGGTAHPEAVLLVSMKEMPALRILELPALYNRFQGQVFLTEPQETANLKLLVSQGDHLLWESPPLNESQPVQPFDLGYDVSLPLEFTIVGSREGEATNYQTASGLQLGLDAYFYNDGTIDDATLQQQADAAAGTRLQARQEEESRRQAAVALDLEEAIRASGFFTQIQYRRLIGENIRLANGETLRSGIVLGGTELLRLNSPAIALDGTAWLAADAVLPAGGVRIRLESSDGRIYYSEALTERTAALEFDYSLTGAGFTVSLINGRGDPVTDLDCKVVLDARLLINDELAEAYAAAQPAGLSDDSGGAS